MPNQTDVRKIGLEVEFAGSKQRVIDELRARGLSSMTREAGYTAGSDHDWMVKHDASVHNGGELVSPPLLWDVPEQRAQVALAMKALVAAGARTTELAGVHVHVNATDLTPRQISGVARTFTKYEDQIYRVATSGWRTMRPGGFSGTGWCKPMQRSVVEKLAAAKTREQVASAWYGPGNANNYAGHGDSSRYHGLNLHSWFYRGTVEFRMFNSTMNAKRVEAYIIMSLAIVQDARDGKLRSINRVFQLGDMKAGLLTEKKAFHHFCQFLRWENETSPISKEDLALISYCWKNSLPQKHPTRLIQATG